MRCEEIGQDYHNYNHIRELEEPYFVLDPLRDVYSWSTSSIELCNELSVK